MTARCSCGVQGREALNDECDLHNSLVESMTSCEGFYPETKGDDAHWCEDRVICSCGCGMVVCVEHDDFADCGDGPAHWECHRQWCNSRACDEQAHEDYLLDQAGL